MLLDASVSHQNYVEDCETCCNPIVLDTRFDHGDLNYAFNANQLRTIKMTFDTRRWVKPQDLNPSGTLFGGRMLAWIDEEIGIYT